MAAGVRLGHRLGPFPGILTPDLVRRYAAATNDPNRGPQAGDVVPPVAVVTQIWAAQQAAFDALVPEETRSTMQGGVHGEHDVVLHRPITPGESLQTWVEAWGSRRGGRHNLVTIRYETRDQREEVVAEQWWTTVLLGAAGDPVGDEAPDHSFPEDARSRSVGVYRLATDADMPRRYAEVSTDWSNHHFEDEAARRQGFNRRFLHGLCTMAICAQGLVELVADGDPARVRRVAVRFASPAYVGDEVTVQAYRASERVYAFEADAGGVGVVRNGVFELR